MRGNESRKELQLVSAGSGCSCCSHEPTESLAATRGTEYALEGLTCSHCVVTVQRAIASVKGVEAASVDLVPGGRSRLVISGSAPREAVRDAVASTGYSLVPR
ncbi:heavy-metal-associated domain-containing protein [Arthrobacter sp. NPDC093139]|uniref:heavy-metal-associated domain-containing protein n=1 Tax=Arthrobacter sp. NPDC093139 TaxID=3363945 RepID=UPI0038275F78